MKREINPKRDECANAYKPCDKIADLLEIPDSTLLESGPVPVPLNFFSSVSGVFGRNPVRLFGPDLREDLKEIRRLMSESKQKYKHFLELESATSTVKELMPRLSKKRANDVAIALYWQLTADAIKLSDDYSSYESFKEYLQNNDYGLITLSELDVVSNSVIGGNLNCLIAIGHENGKGQAGFLKGIFPNGSNLRCGNAEQKFANKLNYKSEMYTDRLVLVRKLLNSIGASSKHITALLEDDTEDAVKEYEDIIAKMAIEEKLEEEQDSDNESESKPVAILKEEVEIPMLKEEVEVPKQDEKVYVVVEPTNIMAQMITAYEGKTAEDEDSSDEEDF